MCLVKKITVYFETIVKKKNLHINSCCYMMRFHWKKSFRSDTYIYLFIYLLSLFKNIDPLCLFFPDKIFKLGFLFSVGGLNTCEYSSMYLKFSTGNTVMGKAFETSPELLCVFIKWLSGQAVKSKVMDH